MSFKKLAALFLLVIILSFGVTNAQAFEGEGEASADFMSTYVWRGINWGGNEGVIQPSVGITAGSFGANLWASYDNEINENVETDLTLTYGRSYEGYSVEAGYIYYALDGIADTQEVYVSVGLDTILSPSLTVYYDFDLGEGAFSVVSIGHSIPLGDKLSLDLGASAGANFGNKVMEADIDGDGKVDDFNGFYNGELSASVTIPVKDNISITPKISHTTALSSDAEDAIEMYSHDKESDVTYGGIGVAISF